MPTDFAWPPNTSWRTLHQVMRRAVLIVVVSLLSGCSGQPSQGAAPPDTNDAAASASPPRGKRAPCTFGADQTCNDDPRVSSIWGRCTELGTCDCNPGFELAPTGYCRPQPQQK